VLAPRQKQPESEGFISWGVPRRAWWGRWSWPQRACHLAWKEGYSRNLISRIYHIKSHKEWQSDSLTRPPDPEFYEMSVLTWTLKNIYEIFGGHDLGKLTEEWPLGIYVRLGLRCNSPFTLPTIDGPFGNSSFVIEKHCRPNVWQNEITTDISPLCINLAARKLMQMLSFDKAVVHPFQPRQCLDRSRDLDQALAAYSIGITGVRVAVHSTTFAGLVLHVGCRHHSPRQQASHFGISTQKLCRFDSIDSCGIYFSTLHRNITQV